MQATANVTKETTEWSRVNWRDSNRVVRNLRQRIFRATRESNWKKVRSLQKLLMRCYSNRPIRKLSPALLAELFIPMYTLVVYLAGLSFRMTPIY